MIYTKRGIAEIKELMSDLKDEDSDRLTLYDAGVALEDFAVALRIAATAVALHEKGEGLAFFEQDVADIAALADAMKCAEINPEDFAKARSYLEELVRFQLAVPRTDGAPRPKRRYK